MGLLNPAYQGGGLNYLGKQPTAIDAPHKWKSSPDHPEAHLAYITDKEQDLLINANLHNGLEDGQPNKGPSGIPSLQGDMGTWSPSVSGGGDEEPSWGGESYDPPSQPTDDSQEYGGVPPTTTEFISDTGYSDYELERGVTDEGQIISSNVYTEPKESNLFDLYMQYGALPNAFRFGKAGLEKLGEWSKAGQEKAMKSWFNARLKNIYDDNPDFEDYESITDIPGSIGEKVREYESNLQGVREGTYNQTNFSEDYGVKTDDRDGDRQLQNLLTPYAPYSMANQTPVESQVNKWFAANQPGTGLSTDYMNTYNTAKAQIANTLGMVDTSNQFGYSSDPYGGLTAQNLATNPFDINWMQQRGLI